MGKIIKEFKHHIPFTAFASVVAVIFTIILLRFYSQEEIGPIFEILHPLHVVFSAFVTAAIYHKYKKGIFMALLIGITGSVLIGSLSDIIFPWLGSLIFSLETHFHLPIIEEPLIILSVAFVGSLVGIFMKKTEAPHLLHVFLSVFASLFYIVAYSANLTISHLISSFIIIFISVIIPCCFSDIIYPLLFVKKK